MRVEVVCSSRETFGADRSALRLAKVLRILGHEPILVVPRDRPELGLSALAAEAGVEIAPAPVVVASSRGADGLRSLADRRARSSADLEVYNTSAVAWRAGGRAPGALIVREWLRPESVRHRLLAAAHAHRARLVVAISTDVASAWRSCIGDRVPIELCHDWLDDDWLGPAVDPAPDREGVLFVGRLNEWKGQEALADAFERAFAGVRGGPSLTFLGAEPPPSPFAESAERLRRRCERSGWTLLERTSNPRPVIERAALLVVPSLHPEPFGTVILEALAAGARVLAFDGGGVDDLAPLFDRTLTAVDRGTAPLADGLARWWAEGGGGQQAAERLRVRATLRERFSEAAAAARWARILERLA